MTSPKLTWMILLENCFSKSQSLPLTEGLYTWNYTVKMMWIEITKGKSSKCRFHSYQRKECIASLMNSQILYWNELAVVAICTHPLSLGIQVGGCELWRFPPLTWTLHHMKLSLHEGSHLATWKIEIVYQINWKKKLAWFTSIFCRMHSSIRILGLFVWSGIKFLES